MPRTKGPPTAAEYALLGLLQEAPAHGYRLAQRFGSDHDLGRLYPLEASMLYALLHDLEARGLIAGQQEVAGPRPPRTLFTITPAGRTYLKAWLDAPVEPIQRLRLDFLLKLYFAARDDAAGASRLIADQLQLGDAYLANLDRELEELEPDTLSYLALESKRVAVASFLTWLASRQEQLRTPREGSGSSASAARKAGAFTPPA